MMKRMEKWILLEVNDPTNNFETELDSRIPLVRASSEPVVDWWSNGGDAAIGEINSILLEVNDPTDS